VKAHLAGRRLDVEANGFLMDFDNLVIARTVNDLPGLENATRSGFENVEASATWRLRSELSLRNAWSWHDARFRDYVAEFDGVPTRLTAKRLEMSPDHRQRGPLWARASGASCLWPSAAGRRTSTSETPPSRTPTRRSTQPSADAPAGTKPASTPGT
jgi:hypothetical protein